MPKFRVTVSETWAHTYIIEAHNATNAREILAQGEAPNAKLESKTFEDHDDMEYWTVEKVEEPLDSKPVSQVECK